MRKRIVALSLCLVLIFSGTIPVFASEKSSGDNISIESTPEESLSSTENYEMNLLTEEVNQESAVETKEEAEKPQEEEAEKPQEEQVEKPQEEQAEKPQEEEAEKPQEEQAEKPQEEQAEKPQEEEAEKPQEEESQEGQIENYSARAAQLYWPVPGHTHLSQGFHGGNAIDISDGSIGGAKVIAAIGGTVTHIYLCGSQHYGSNHTCNGFGTGLVIAGDDGRIYQYAHMQGGSIPGNVYRTARVEAGQTIGAVGTTGNSSGNHLHFGISIGNYWNASGINPQYENYIYGESELSTSWSAECLLADTTNAVIKGTITTNRRVQFTNAGAYVWDPNGNLIAQPSEGTSVAGTLMNIQYDMGMELGIWLNPGTSYTYQFWAVAEGKTYYSGIASFSTTGTTPVTGVEISAKQADMKIGDKLTLTSSVLPSYANDKSISWSSDNNAVATVSGGVVTAIGAGKATIIAKAFNGVSASCVVTVAPKEIIVETVTPSIGGRAADALRLNWGKNPNADGYIIEQDKGGKWVRIARIGNNSTVTYRVEKLSASTTYKFRMQAFKMDGSNAKYSAYTTISGKTNPAQVTGLKIGGRAADALRLNWNKNSTASGYIVEQYKSGKWVRIARIANNSTVTYRVEKLGAGTTYKFRIQAFGFDGNTPVYGNYTMITGKTNPSVVTGLKIGGRATDALRLNWNKNSSAEGYIIERYKEGEWIRIARIANNTTTTFRAEGLEASKIYIFRIRTFGFEGNTPLYSENGSVSGKTNPKTVTNLKIGGVAKDALRLNWTKNPNADGYIIEQNKDGKWVRIARTSTNSVVTYRVEKLRPTTTYQFRVQTYDFDGYTPIYSVYQYISGKTAK